MFYSLNYNFYNIIKFKKDITEKVPLVVLHGLATIDDSNNKSLKFIYAATACIKPTCHGFLISFFRVPYT